MQCENGRILRHNRQDLLKTQEPLSVLPMPETDTMCDVPDNTSHKPANLCVPGLPAVKATNIPCEFATTNVPNTIIPSFPETLQTDIPATVQMEPSQLPVHTRLGRMVKIPARYK